MRLNLGCGQDDWGEVRLDVASRTGTGAESRLNVRGDAHHLPFIDYAFAECRCWHVLEHVKEPDRVLGEIRRVALEADVRFPVDEGYWMHMLVGVFNLDWRMVRGGLLTWTRRLHRWIIKHPDAQVSERFIEYPDWRVRQFVPRIMWRKWRRTWRYYYELKLLLGGECPKLHHLWPRSPMGVNVSHMFFPVNQESHRLICGCSCDWCSKSFKQSS